MPPPGQPISSRSFSLKKLFRQLSPRSQAAHDLENAGATGGADGQSAGLDEANTMWWNASKQRIRDYISGIPTSSSSEASPTIVVRRSDKNRSVEIITNSAAYRKRLEKSAPELQKLVRAPGYRVCIVDSKHAAPL